MVKPPRNLKGRENPILKWWWCCGKSVNKGDKRFEDLIQTIANGEEGCDDDETKWKRIGSNKGWWSRRRSVRKDKKRFEDFIQTNGEEEGCDDDDESKWKRIISNKKVNNKESMLRFLGAPFRLCDICGRRSMVHQSTQK